MRELKEAYNHTRVFGNPYAGLWDTYLLYCWALPVERIARDSKQLFADNTETLRGHCGEDKADTTTAAICYFCPPICCILGTTVISGVCITCCPVVSLTTCGLFGYKTCCEASTTNREPEPALPAAPLQQQMDDNLLLRQLEGIDDLLHFPGQPFTLS